MNGKNSMEPDLSVTLGRIRMKNPVTTASGTYGQGDIFQDFYDINILGALTTKSVTLNPRAGNPPPRLYETSSGYLNSIGLQNPGIKKFISQYKSFFEKLSIPVIISIAGTSVEEYALLAEQISSELPVQGIEINISCPNVKEEGIQFAMHPKSAASVVKAVRAKTGATIITKLTPNTEQNVEIAKACVQEGSDVIAIMNTLKGMAINLNTRKPVFKNVCGGLSGPAVKPVALRWVYEIGKNTSHPVLGMGGITTAMDALEFMVCGATAVSVGTANFFNPMVIPEIVNGMREWLKEKNISRVSSIIGTIQGND